MRLKMHAKRHLSYDDQKVGIVWTRCCRNVEQSQIAAFEPDGVTCRNCLAHLNWEAENEREWAERRKQGAQDAA